MHQGAQLFLAGRDEQGQFKLSRPSPKAHLLLTFGLIMYQYQSIPFSKRSSGSIPSQVATSAPHQDSIIVMLANDLASTEHTSAIPL
jgi:hypothetical protein